jgi:hypothetical protein
VGAYLQEERTVSCREQGRTGLMVVPWLEEDCKVKHRVVLAGVGGVQIQSAALEHMCLFAAAGHTCSVWQRQMCVVMRRVEVLAVVPLAEAEESPWEGEEWATIHEVDLEEPRRRIAGWGRGHLRH